MGKNIAEVIRKEGMIEGDLKQQREDLLRALRVKFMCVPAEVEEEINGTTDVKKLAGWLVDVVMGKRFSEIRFSCSYDLSRMTWKGESEHFEVEDMGRIFAEFYEDTLKERRRGSVAISEVEIQSACRRQSKRRSTPRRGSRSSTTGLTRSSAPRRSPKCELLVGVLRRIRNRT